MKLFQNKRAAPQPESPHYEELAAEYRNYRRRTAQALERAEQEATQKVVLEFLPLYDDLARALHQPCQDAAYFRGVELMMQKLLSILAAMKVQPMDSLHRCFNPDYHEAVEHVEDPQYREEEIIEVLQTGFTMDEDVIRHAKVIVAN